MVAETSALTGNDARYEEMFNVERETVDHGGVLIEDLYPKLAVLRARSPILAGDLHQSLTGVPNPGTPPRITQP